MSDYLSVDLYIKREDLFPYYVGTNKGRKYFYLDKSINIKEYSSIVTNGGVNSNHLRSTAIYAAQHQLDCHLVIHDDYKIYTEDSDAIVWLRNRGARTYLVRSQNISDKLQEIERRLASINSRVLVIQGGGHHSSGLQAYIDVGKEVLNQIDYEYNLQPDYIFSVCGTGTTHTGIQLGIHSINSMCVSIAISIGRNAQRAYFESEKIALENKYTGEALSSQIILDDWLMGGYGKFEKDRLPELSNFSKLLGLPLDTSYTGKAFLALSDMIQDGRISKNQRIVFLMTGNRYSDENKLSH